MPPALVAEQQPPALTTGAGAAGIGSDSPRRIHMPTQCGAFSSIENRVSKHITHHHRAGLASSTRPVARISPSTLPVHHHIRCQECSHARFASTPDRQLDAVCIRIVPSTTRRQSGRLPYWIVRRAASLCVPITVLAFPWLHRVAALLCVGYLR